MEQIFWNLGFLLEYLNSKPRGYDHEATYYVIYLVLL